MVPARTTRQIPTMPSRDFSKPRDERVALSFIDDLQMVDALGQTFLGRMDETEICADSGPDEHIGNKKIVHGYSKKYKPDWQ
jgi:hypothetical protein